MSMCDAASARAAWPASSSLLGFSFAFFLEHTSGHSNRFPTPTGAYRHGSKYLSLRDTIYLRRPFPFPFFQHGCSVRFISSGCEFESRKSCAKAAANGFPSQRALGPNIHRGDESPPRKVFLLKFLCFSPVACLLQAPMSSSPYDRSDSPAAVNALAGVLRFAPPGGASSLRSSLRPTGTGVNNGGGTNNSRDNSPRHRPRPSTEPRKKLPDLPSYGSAATATGGGGGASRNQLNRVFPERQPSSNVTSPHSNSRLYQQTSSGYNRDKYGQPRQSSAPATPSPERQQQQQQQQEQEHWVELFDETHQLPYYFNPKTHETRWAPPDDSVRFLCSCCCVDTVWERFCVDL